MHLFWQMVGRKKIKYLSNVNNRCQSRITQKWSEVPPRTLSHRDYSTPSLKLNPFLRLMPPLGHLKYDVLKTFLYHSYTIPHVYKHLSLCTGSKLLTLTFLKIAPINNHIHFNCL